MWEMVEAMNLRRHKGLECKLYKPFGILRKEINQVFAPVVGILVLLI